MSAESGIEPRETTFHKDLLDLLTEASKVVEVKKLDGKEIPVETHDYESLYWSTRSVNSPQFARFVLKLKELEMLGAEAGNNMMPERASQISAVIMRIVRNYKYSIDGKAAESIRDKRNTQSTLVDKISRHRVEKAYTNEDRGGKNFLRSLIARDEEQG